MKSLTIKQKFIWLLVVTVTVFTGVGGVVYFESDTLENEWQSFVDEIAHREELISEIQKQLGYGEGIHNTKNFILRQKPEYAVSANLSFDKALGFVHEYEQLPYLSSAEEKALFTLKATIQKYIISIDTAKNLYRQNPNVNPSEVDNKVEIDDEPAKAALRQLNLEYKRLLATKTNKIHEVIIDLQVLVISAFALLSVFLVIGFVIFYRSIAYGLQQVSEFAKSIAQNKLDSKLALNSKDEIADLGDQLVTMQSQLLANQESIQNNDWLKTNLNSLLSQFQSYEDRETLAQNTIREACKLLDAKLGLFYVQDENKTSDGRNIYKLQTTYAYKERKQMSNSFADGEGIVGQAALERSQIVLTSVPSDYITISSGAGEKAPTNLVVQPITHQDRVHGIIEIGSLHEFTPTQKTFIEQMSSDLGIVMSNLEAKEITKKLYEESKAKTIELENQSEKLQKQSKELELQSRELEKSNEELERQTDVLKEAQKQTEIQNRELEQTRFELEHKADELTRSNKYKSEFLANMSHELRTPLNSILILSKLLQEAGELKEEYKNHAGVIKSAGEDLLALIDEILDLAKIEAGKMTVNVSEFPLKNIISSIESTFSVHAQDKGIPFSIAVDDNAPINIKTDYKRVLQILKNFLSNAFKFTEKGSIKTTVKSIDDEKFVISVKDSGIGIPKEKQSLIFQAFQQADGSTERKYGGTGLGLSISKAIAESLGGEITLESKEGEGSLFSLILPKVTNQVSGTPTRNNVIPMRELPSVELPDASSESAVADDRKNIQNGDKTVLIIEDDPSFATIMRNFAREAGFKTIISGNGANGLSLAKSMSPSAIVLDIELPLMSGWEVLQNLKLTTQTRNIPVQIISSSEDAHFGHRLGAIKFHRKPITDVGIKEVFSTFHKFFDRPAANILVVEDNKLQQQAIGKLFEQYDIKIDIASSANAAMAKLSKQTPDALVLDMKLPDMSGYEILKKIQQFDHLKKMPIIVYTGKTIEQEEEAKILEFADSIILKTVESHVRLMDEIFIFLHRAESPSTIPFHTDETEVESDGFNGQKILVVDDDTRNIYTLAAVLELKDLKVLTATNGQEALKLLDEHDDIAFILMDIMMPIMDGYTAMGAIRRRSDHYADIPIVAVTAKAMKDEKEKCIAAGANHYFSKPLDYTQLFTKMSQLININTKKAG